MTRDGVTQARAFRFNAQQRLLSVTTESGTTTYESYPDGTLLRKTDAKGQKVEYVYDGLNRLWVIKPFPAGALQPDACQSVALYYDTNYIPGISDPNPQGHVTEAVSGAVHCAAGQIIEMFDYTKGGMVSFKRMKVVKNTPQGVLENFLDWTGAGCARSSRDGVLPAEPPDRLRVRCDGPVDRDELGRFC